MAGRRLAGGLALLHLVALPSAAASQDESAARRSPLVLQRISSAVRFDGRVDEPAWADIEPLTAFGHSPTFGAEPSERTEFRVGYDEQYLYFSCRAWDSDPNGPRASSLRRDDGSFSNDWCVIQLDTFNDEETALVFGTNPAGVRTDAVFPNDATTGPNFSWNTFWDAEVHRDGDGWSAEIRIPFSSLRFQNEPGTDRVVMGLALWRRIARRNEMITFPAISPRWGDSSQFKASQFQDVVFSGIAPSRPLYATPYALGGVGRTNVLDDAGVGYEPDDRGVREVGLDLKAGVASNATLDLTFNTDFAQVEADDQQINLTRFSLFFPEKRLFFQERSSVFEYPLGGNERLFHSRRVGLVEGEQVPIHAGGRFVARMGEWDVGFLDMQTGTTDVSRGENLGVLRARRRVLNENSYVGGIVTSRIARGGGHNAVYALDVLLRVRGQDYVTLNWGQAFEGGDGAVAGPVEPMDRALTRLLWERRGQDGLTYLVGMTRSGEAFEPGLGFLRRRDYTSYSGMMAYGWRPDESSRLLRHTLRVPGTAWTSNADGSTETIEVLPSYEIELKSGRSLTASGSWIFEDLEEGFSVGDATIPAGEHSFATVRVAHASSESELFGFTTSIEAGGYYDGRRVALSASSTWIPSRHLTLSGTYSVDDVRFPERGEAFTAHIARLRVQLMANNRVSTAAFVQYSSAADLVGANVRFRYNPSEGHDLYVVWNQGINTDRWSADPVRPLNRQATLLVKYSRTLTMGL